MTQSRFFIVLSALMFVFPSAYAAPKKSIKSEDALKVMSLHKHVGSYLGLLVSTMSKEDAAYLNSEIKKSKIDLNAPFKMKIVEPNVVVIPGVKGSITFQDNGAVALYKGVSLRWNPEWSFQKNTEKFKQELARISLSSSFWIPSANAAENFTERTRETAISIAQGLRWMTEYQTSPAFKKNADIMQNPDYREKFDAIFRYGSQSLVKDVECGKIKARENEDAISKIIIRLENGKFVTMENLGKGAVGTFVTDPPRDANGNPINRIKENGYPEGEEMGGKVMDEAIFTNLAESFCSSNTWLDLKDQIKANLRDVQKSYKVDDGSGVAH